MQVTSVCIEDGRLLSPSAAVEEANLEISTLHRRTVRFARVLASKDAEIAALVATIRELLKGGQHEGPCVNSLDDEDADTYNKWDTCARHIAAAKERKQNARRFLEKYSSK